LDKDDQYGSIAPPTYQTATFRQPTATEFGEYDYNSIREPDAVARGEADRIA